MISLIKQLIQSSPALFLLNAGTEAANFGVPGNQFTIEFVTIDNPGNASDSGAGGGAYKSPHGAVDHAFQMSIYETSTSMINSANAIANLGITLDVRLDNKPATSVSWNEAARFVNWLNTNQGYSPAYKFSIQPGVSGYSPNANIELWLPTDPGYNPKNLFRNSNAHYFLPSEDEWYKAAFHKNDGSTANYWDYPTASNSAPKAVVSGTADGTAVFGNDSIANVNSAGGPSAYGTFAQGGNASEWCESSIDNTNDDPFEARLHRGGNFLSTSSEFDLRATRRGDGDPTDSYQHVGFRVASIPEPSSLLLLLVCASHAVLKRQKKATEN
ncbi:MAG: hypothetical protein JWL59_4397 [Chthoniobacteraceae bacterium]|nr:hypothetical protein [Chthoniobacteraceae bacterium]